MTEYKILIMLFVFIGFAVFLVGIGGPSIIQSDNIRDESIIPSQTEQCQDPGFFDALGCWWDNVAFFFKFVGSVSTGIAWFGAIVVTAIIGVLSWMIINAIRGR